ncbi:MAG: hypothetical protein OXG96_14980 [Acidobacteria bacterium]|nr:hypothetical protein [Acidobacteriota bacterium]
MPTVKEVALGLAPEARPGSQVEFDGIWRQACEGLDADRLLPSREKRTRDLQKKLDRPLERNGWRLFVSGLAHAMLNGKARQKRNAEVMLVETVARWRAQVLDLLPDRERDLQRIVRAGIANPEPPPEKRGL